MLRSIVVVLISFIAQVTIAADVEHVIVIGVDGLSPAGISQADTPNLDALFARGAHTMHARAVMPTSSSSNWASMFMGAGPEQHGITSNDWEPDKFDIAPTVRGAGGMFPTVFSALRSQRPDAVIGVFHDWGGFGRLVEKDVCNVKQSCAGPKATINRTVEFLLEFKPLLTVVHLDHVDHAGHEHGWGTPQYVAAVEEADSLVGRVTRAVEEGGMTDSTMLFVTSDHGGRDKGHGGATMEEIEIPWIVAGPRIRAGYILSQPVDIYDTAATIAHVLGIAAPEGWIAQPVLEAFER